MPKRGSIILVPFPFTDLSGTKVRPALVVSVSLRGEDMIVVFISSKKGQGKGSRLSPFDIVVLPSKQNGLKTQSVIRCAKIATLEKKIAIGEIGTLEKNTTKQVNDALKNIFAL